MKKLAIGLLLVLAGIGTVSVATLPVMAHKASGPSTSGATFAQPDL